MDIEECIDYTSQVLNVDKARAELDKLHQRITELDLSVENGTAIVRENTVLLARVSELESQQQEAYEKGWKAAIETAAVMLENYPVDMLKIDGDELDDVVDRDIDIAAELRALKVDETPVYNTKPGVCRVCGGDGIQDSGVRGKRPCVACDGTGQRG